MKVKWLGHAAFLLSAEEGTKIITDPYVPGAYDGAVGYSPIKEMTDVVTVSHDHADHNGTNQLPGSPQIIKGKGAWTVKGIKISGIGTFHDPNSGRERGRNTVFVYEIDRVRVVHLGDLGHIPDEATANSIGRVDVLLIPVGGTFTIDAEEARQVVALLKPRLVIPMHYKTPKLGFAIAGVEEFLKLASGVKRTGQSEVAISAANLPEETETWVLVPAL